MSKTDVVLAETIFTPVMSTDAAIECFKKFQIDKKKILDSSDYAQIKVNSKQSDGKWKTTEIPFVKKSGWNKLGCFYGANSETTKYQKVTNEDGSYVYIVSVRAYSKLPDGREYSVERSAAVSSLEKEKTEGMKNSPRKEHDVISSAETRAVGRAMAAYFGTGEVSAEEMSGGTLENVDAHNVPESQSKKVSTICQCVDDAVNLSKDGKGCLTCQTILDEEKRKRIWEKTGFTPS